MLKTLDELFELVIERKASDIILLADSAPAIWVAGEMQTIEHEPIQPEHVDAMLTPLLNDEEKAVLAETGDLDFSVGKPDVGRFRINLHKQRGGLSAALRFVPDRIPTLENLNLPPRLSEFAKLPRGMVLVTGGAATGKSTTLAAMIDFMNRNFAYHIITLEDPIEYAFSHQKSLIEQREIGKDARSFSSALRHVVRQRPDVILVGEMRDLETVAAALTAAEIGHMVLATLHTSSAVQTVDRIIDAFPGSQQAQVRIQLSAVLTGVACQMLFPDQLEGGLIPAVEILVPTPAIRRAVRDNETHLLSGMLEMGRSLGMQSMDMSISTLVAEGRVTPEQAMANAHDPEKMKRLLAA